MSSLQRRPNVLENHPPSPSMSRRILDSTRKYSLTLSVSLSLPLFLCLSLFHSPSFSAYQYRSPCVWFIQADSATNIWPLFPLPCHLDVRVFTNILIGSVEGPLAVYRTPQHRGSGVSERNLKGQVSLPGSVNKLSQRDSPVRTWPQKDRVRGNNNKCVT